MTIREFCRQPGYDRALLLTWSFDAVFFERVVLPELETGGTHVPLIIADTRQVNSAIDRWHGQVQRLGRHYVLETASTAGSFHAKLILRIGQGGSVVWLGTGNVSAAGFGGNRELGTVWKVGPGEADPGAWVPELLNDVGSWCSGPASRHILDRLKSASWLAETPTAVSTETCVLWSHGTSLADQLTQRWRGRRFDTLYVTTGSTDKDGSFLKWAHDTFGVQKAIVAVHASSAIFDASRMERLPLEVRFVQPPKHKALHAKCYWFEGLDGVAAVFGSANCSGSAWLKPVNAGGNVEILGVFDTVERSGWSHILSEFDGSTLTPAEYLRERLSSDDTTEYARPYQLKSVEFDRFESQVRVVIEPNVHDTARITLIVEENDPIHLTYLGDAAETTWAGPLPELFGSARPLFARVRIETDSGVVETLPRWMDQTVELRRATHDRRVSNALIQFGLANDSDKSDKILEEDIQRAMDLVISGNLSYEDQPLRNSYNRADSTDDTIKTRLDPQQVAVDLGTRMSGEMARGTPGSDGSYGYGGVLDVFFGGPGAEIDPPDEQLVSEGNEAEHQPNPASITKRTTLRNPSDRHKKRIQVMMATYLKRLREPIFAITCTATQLRDAITFPLAVAMYGLESGRVDADHARKWVLSAVSVAFHEQIIDRPHVGLLDQVAARYEIDGRRETFDRVFGDGVFWIAAMATLSGLKWTTPGGRVERMLLFRDIFSRNDLLREADLGKLGLTAARLRLANIAESAFREFPNIVRVLHDTEAWLQTNFESLVGSENQKSFDHQQGDPLWRPTIGWVIVEEVLPDHDRLMVRPWRSVRLKPSTEIIRVAASWYVNVRCIMESTEGMLKEFEALVVATY